MSHVEINLSPDVWSKICELGIKMTSKRVDLGNGLHGFANVISAADAAKLGIKQRDGA